MATITMKLRVLSWIPEDGMFVCTYTEWNPRTHLRVPKPVIMCIAGRTGLPESYLGQEFEFTLDSTETQAAEPKREETEGFGSW